MMNMPENFLKGRMLLELPQINKGTAFSREERLASNLLGMLPYSVETLDQQVKRAYKAFSSKDSALEQHIYLRQLLSFNETLYYGLIIKYAEEVLPIIYTPTVGRACEDFSEIYRKPHGLFLNYPEIKHIDEILDNVENDIVDVIVVTDGEAILGIGDQGVGGMGIPIGKLGLYSALGGINPKTTLPVVFDVGTDNQKLLNDPFYVGLRQNRIRGQKYDEFVELALTAIHRKWPHAIIQFEDFGQSNSQRLLDIYANRLCCFNDDIQGTAAVTVGSLIAACRVIGRSLKDLTIVIAGAGAAGVGVANGCLAAMVEGGLDRDSACKKIYLLNSSGLVCTDSDRLHSHQKPFARIREELSGWEGDFQLLSVIQNIRPDVLIGVSGRVGLFSEQIIRQLAASCERPFVFPLSNPTSNIEAVPEDILEWTDGRAVIATGSPFENVNFNGVRHHIAQCNNAYAFPGIGLGLAAVKAKRATDEMFTATSKVIGTAQSNVHIPGASLLPPLGDVRSLSRDIAMAVANIAIEQNLTGITVNKPVAKLIDEKIWNPTYHN